MAYFEKNSKAMVTLEEMVDSAGLSNVIYALSHICRAKAEHLETDWSDAAGAKAYEKRAKKLDKLAPLIADWADAFDN